jgi:hypothetical protein
MAHTAHCDRRWALRLAGCTLSVALLGAACTPAPALTPQQQVDQIIAFVQVARGHDFLTQPTVEFLDPATFQAEVLADLATAEADVDADDVAFTALDWITPAQDLFTEYEKAFGTGVVGFYDPADESLKVRGTTLTPYRREVIAHELTHALDDQVFDLDDITSSGLLDEQYLSALVAIEGSASKVQQRYFDSMSALDRVADLNEQLAAGSDPTLLTVPVALLTITTAPYLRGAAFQQQLIGALGNPAGPDLSLTRYPSNTEQAFDTSSYLADEPAVAVPVPPTEGAAAVVRSGELGPFSMSLVLREGLVLDTLDPAAAGWAGGSYVTWLSGGQSCIRADTTMDSGSEADTLEAALAAWGGRHPGAVVERTAPGTVRLTRCDG